MPSTILFINFIYLPISIAAFHKNLSESSFGINPFLPCKISESFHNTASPGFNFTGVKLFLIFLDVLIKLKNLSTLFKDFVEFFFDTQ